MNSKASKYLIKKISNLNPKDVETLILNSDPWKRLGFSKRDAYQMAKPFKNRIQIGVFCNKKLVGFAMFTFGFLGGAYLNNLVVSSDHRDQGLGRKLILGAEKIVFKKSKNFYLCVSSFNKRGQEFYKRLGFKRIGSLKSLIIKDADEMLFRKSTGPLR